MDGRTDVEGSFQGPPKDAYKIPPKTCLLQQQQQGRSSWIASYPTKLPAGHRSKTAMAARERPRGARAVTPKDSEFKKHPEAQREFSIVYKPFKS